MSRKIQLFFSCFILITAFACNKDDDATTEPDPTVIPADVLYYFRGDVDGQAVQIDVTATNGNINLIGHGGSGIFPNCLIAYGGSVGNQNEDPPFFGFDFVNYFDGLCENETTQFPNLFSVGDVNYQTSDNVNLPKEVTISYSTSNTFDGEYRSEYGDQTGSTFTITKVTEANNAFGLYQDIEASFNCKLYKTDDPTQIIEIENGIFKLNVGSYYN